jgi:O-antigen/teichoic acid export membrane protein
MPFLYYFLLSRLLPPDAVGVLSVLTFFLTLFNVLQRLALPTAATKFIAEYLGAGRATAAGSIARTALRITGTITLAVVATGALLAPTLAQLTFGDAAYTTLLRLVLVISAVTNVAVLLGSFLLGLSAFATTAALTTVTVVAPRVGALLVAGLGYGLEGILWGQVAGAMLSVAVAILLVRGRLDIRKGYERVAAMTLLGYSLPIFAKDAITILQTRIDSMLLYAMTGRLDVTGIYYLVTASTQALSVLWVPITMVLFPTLSAQNGRGQIAHAGALMRTAMRLFNITVLPLGAAVAAASGTAITLVYGPAYLTGQVAFALLCIAAILVAYTTLFMMGLQAIAKTRALLVIGVVAVGIDVAVTVALAPSLGVVGAAVARVAMYAAMLTLSYRALRRHLVLRVDVASLTKSLVNAAAIAAPILLFETLLADRFALSLATRTLVDGALLIGLVVLTMRTSKVLRVGDFDLLRHALPRPLHPLLRYAERLLR